MLQEMIKAFFLIFVAEMGDKTQILAMAFATRYPVKKVLAGIFFGALLNHGLAVALGSYISNFVPINTIQTIAGVAFVGFSLWTLKSEEGEDEEESGKIKFGPVLTVASAFFIGELGDKTQLTAITLATDAAYPVLILCGTVLGMIATGGIGIIIGKKLGDKIPEFTIKIVAATVFMFFGTTKLYQTLPDSVLTPVNILLFAAVMAVAAFVLLRPELKRRRLGKETALVKQSRALYNYYHQVGAHIEKICLGPDVCGGCKGEKCPIGYTKCLIRDGLDENNDVIREDFVPNAATANKPFNRKQLIESLRLTLEVMRDEPSNMDEKNINAIRRNLEQLLMGKSIDKILSWDAYKQALAQEDKSLAEQTIGDVSLWLGSTTVNQ